MIIIGKHINGISLNGLEYLLTSSGDGFIYFESKEKAKEFLRENGFEELTDEELEDSFTFATANSEGEVKVVE